MVTESTWEAETFRLVRLKPTRPSGTGGTALQDLTYVYDAVGNVSSKGDAAQDTIYFANTMVTPEETYLYDALHRLIEATGRESVSGITGPVDVPGFVGAMPATTAPSAMRRYTESYTYDEADNLLEQKHFAGTVGQNPVWTRTFNVESTSNKMESTTDGTTTWPVTYSDRGAVTALPHLSTMTRDHRDQLVGITFGSDSASYRYDADGQRVVRRVTKSGKLEERLYLGSTEVFRRYDSGGTLEHERWSQWVSDGVSRVLVLDQVGSVFDTNDLPADEERWQLADLLGSGVVEVDGTGAVICAEGYHPYGSTAWVSGKSQREVKSRRFRYTGKERDDESGLQAHGVRMYAPWLGRWMSADPIGLGDGLNRHLYVHANPVRGRDPNGTLEEGADPDLDVDEPRPGKSQSQQVREDMVNAVVDEVVVALRWTKASLLTVMRRGSPEQDAARWAEVERLTAPEMEQLWTGGTLVGSGSVDVATARTRDKAAEGIKKIVLGSILVGSLAPGNPGKKPAKSVATKAGKELIEDAAQHGASKKLAKEVTEHGADASKAAGGGYDFALGLSKHPDHVRGGLVGRFSEHVGAKTYWDLYDNTSDMRVMGQNLLEGMHKADHIHFNLDGMIRPGTTFDDLVKYGSEGIGQGNVTNWELYQVVSKPALRGKATFTSTGLRIHLEE